MFVQSAFEVDCRSDIQMTVGAKEHVGVGKHGSREERMVRDAGFEPATSCV